MEDVGETCPHASQQNSSDGLFATDLTGVLMVGEVMSEKSFSPKEHVILYIPLL